MGVGGRARRWLTNTGSRRLWGIDDGQSTNRPVVFTTLRRAGAPIGGDLSGDPTLSHLALAGPLRKAGYEVQIVDPKWDTNWRSLVRHSQDRLLCAGITSLTGPSVSDGLESFAKQLRPDLPLIWGGWHASFAAQQVMEDPRVDIVVRGMRTFLEVVQAIEAGGPLAGICGIHYRDRGTIASTSARPPEDINNFPPPAYDLIKPERYVMELPGETAKRSRSSAEDVHSAATSASIRGIAGWD
jgi:radical SAM superfamily enzyme YgiQ (UPF0313 family)